MPAKKRAQRKPRRHNPAAKALRSPAYRPRVVKSKKAYTRRAPAPGEADPDAQ
jgi:hypothetical protein